MPSLDLAAALHSERHAAGGPDPITPASIGAAPLYGPTYNGHINDLTTPGTYRIQNGTMNAANGYPWVPHSAGYVIVGGYSSAYVTQEVISETGTTWRRNTVSGGRGWYDWTPISVDTGWRTHPLDNGWTGDLRYRWRNGIVSVSVTDLDGTNATVVNIVINFGGHPGFHAGAGTPAYGFGNSTVTGGRPPQGSEIGSIGLVGGGANSIMRASSISGWRGGAASMTYVASSATLPVTLPGTPV